MYSLLIDTHDKDIVLCLYQDKKILDSRIKESSREHSDFTMPLLDELLKSNSVNVNMLNEIIVINGPGSFTGVRIGVTIAKMLAYTLKIKIKTITSLEMYAISSESVDNKLVLIRDIKGAYGAVFNKDNMIVKDYFYLNNPELNDLINDNNYVIFENQKPDLEKIIEYAETKEYEPVHAVNPIYIKLIEALKNDKNI